MFMITSSPRRETELVSGLFRFTAEQYERLAEAGVLTEDDQVELLNGLLVVKMTKGQLHTAALVDTRDALSALVPHGWHVQTEAAVRILNFDEPELDLAVVRGKARDYARLRRPPESSEVALIVEVAEASLDRDRSNKWAAYASGGIPIYWIVNLVDEQVEVYTNPSAAGYQSREDYKPGQDISVQMNGLEQGRIAVAAILP